MRSNWTRMQKWASIFASGGVTLGLLQGLSMVNWAYLFTSWLSQWFSTLVALLFGGRTTTGM